MRLVGVGGVRRRERDRRRRWADVSGGTRKLAVAVGHADAVVSVGLPVATAADWGVRRISLGGALASLAYKSALAAAEEIAEQGTFTTIGQAPQGRPLNPIFAAT